MLKRLLIKNYALIRNLELHPSDNLNTVTGETGAGKSIMLGAIGLLLGNRADTRVLFSGDEKCVIEGIFDVRKHNVEELFVEADLDYEDLCIIRREITPSGKSRAFINDTPVVLEVMKKIGGRLVDVHSQRDTLLLGSSAFQTEIVDAYASHANLLEAYRTRFSAYRNYKKEMEALESQAEELRKEADYNHFLYEELQGAQLETLDQEYMEKELQLLEHAEEIKTRLVQSVELLLNEEFAAVGRLREALKSLEPIGQYAEKFESLAKRLSSSMLEVKDIADELEAEERNIEFDQAKLEEVEERLSTLYRLQQKHHVDSVQALVEIREALHDKMNRTRNMDASMEEAASKLRIAWEEVLQSGQKLSASRRAVLPRLSDELEHILKDLGMPHASIVITCREAQPSATGADDIEILFSANAGVPPDALKNIASGGEFSRFMFAVKQILASVTNLPTIIFDEIDSGISGEVSMKLGRMIYDMSKRHQVVCITHLPQIAARGKAHFFVYKENEDGVSATKIRQLNGEERVFEVASMIGGNKPSEVAVKNARELLSEIS
jgi:DNA repair protein RecN (Recombination protein N)